MSIVKLNNRAVSNASTFGSISSLGEMVFISKATASSSASIEFSLGDYKEYQFYFYDIHPSTDNVQFEFNLSTDNGSNYNVTKTTTAFYSYHNENDASSGLGYTTLYDLAQSTSNQKLAFELGIDNDQSSSGYLHLFNPSSNTFVKHFISNFETCRYDDLSENVYIAGYGNTISPITNIKFQMSSGNIDSGEILLFGIN